MKTHRRRIGNEQESKGGLGFVGTAAGRKTDSATAQSSLGQADGVCPLGGRVALQAS